MAELNQQTIDELTGLTVKMRGYADQLKAGVLSPADFKTYQQQIDAERKALEARLDAIESKANTPLATRNGGGNEIEAKATRLFVQTLKTGNDAEYKAFIAEHTAEFKAMTLTDSTTGGYWAPVEFVNEMIKAVTDISPMRQVARVRPTGSNSIQMPKRVRGANAYWVGENTARADGGNPTYGMEEIPTHEMAAYSDISQQNIEDAQYDIEADLRQDIAEGQALLEGTAFVSGNGVSKPEGILVADAVTIQASGAAATIPNADCLKRLQAKVKEAYQLAARWMMSRTTRLEIELLKDGQGRYIWQPDYTQGSAGLLFGKPITIDETFPSIAANAYPVLYGDIAAAYTIVDRIGISYLRDPYTQAGTGLVRIHARKRTGGRVVQAAAIAKLQVKAS
jgi:HK97 family phage major capsid protein